MCCFTLEDSEGIWEALADTPLLCIAGLGLEQSDGISGLTAPLLFAGSEDWSRLGRFVCISRAAFAGISGDLTELEEGDPPGENISGGRLFCDGSVEFMVAFKPLPTLRSSSCEIGGSSVDASSWRTLRPGCNLLQDGISEILHERFLRPDIGGPFRGFADGDVATGTRHGQNITSFVKRNALSSDALVFGIVATFAAAAYCHRC